MLPQTGEITRKKRKRRGALRVAGPAHPAAERPQFLKDAIRDFQELAPRRHEIGDIREIARVDSERTADPRACRLVFDGDARTRRLQAQAVRELFSIADREELPELLPIAEGPPRRHRPARHPPPP